jgi:hypothetical protein
MASLIPGYNYDIFISYRQNHKIFVHPEAAKKAVTGQKNN